MQWLTGKILAHSAPFKYPIPNCRSEWLELINCATNSNIDHLKKLAFDGSLKNTKFRSISWSILLRVLSNDPAEWRNQRAQQRDKYEQLKQEFLKNPHENTSLEDDPLSQSDESVWNQYFGDQELFSVIKQDVIRTFPGIEFFRKDAVQESMVSVCFCFAFLW